MINWYNRIVSDLSLLDDCINYYENELEDARKELSIKGKTLEKHGSEIPGIVEHRFRQLQEIEGILEFLNINYRKIKHDKFRNYLEKYNRELTSRDAEKYAENDPDVIDMAVIVNNFALLRNKFLAISKGIDQKGWMLGHITKLRSAGLEDIEL